MNFGNISGLVNGTEQVVFDYEVPFGTNVIGSGTASASSDNGNVAANAFDGNVSTYWRSLTESPNGAWIKYDFGSGVTKTIRALKLNSDSNQSYKFGPFNFQGSNNDSDWTTVASLVDAVTASEPTGYKTLSFANSTAYRYYRLIGTGANPAGTGTVIYNEIQMSESGPESSISTGNILNGDEDGWYTIIVRGITANNQSRRIHFNGDTTSANYGYRGFNAANTTVSNASATNDGVYSGGTLNGYSDLSIHKVYAKSGSVRLINTVVVDGITGTTVSNLYPLGHVWNNSVDNIVSIQLDSVAGSALGVGTRIIILKSNNFTNGTPTGVINTPYIQGSWVRVGTAALTDTGTNITFNGLDGDRDVLYYLSCRYKAAGGAVGPRIRLNNDATSGNYGQQTVYGQSTTVAAARSATETGIQPDFGATSGNYSTFCTFLFAKSGFLRPSLSSAVSNINGTTVDAAGAFGTSWTNTADNITQLLVTAPANSFDIGSQFDLYALRPNG